jgi:hypothetical protein
MRLVVDHQVARMAEPIEECRKVVARRIYDVGNPVVTRKHTCD